MVEGGSGERLAGEGGEVVEECRIAHGLFPPERERERQTETEREGGGADRQTDRDTERGREREGERERDRDRKRQREIETERRRETETERDKERETETQRERQTDRERHTHRQRKRERQRVRERESHRHRMMDWRSSTHREPLTVPQRRAKGRLVSLVPQIDSRVSVPRGGRGLRSDGCPRRHGSGDSVTTMDDLSMPFSLVSLSLSRSSVFFPLPLLAVCAGAERRFRIATAWPRISQSRWTVRL